MKHTKKTALTAALLTAAVSMTAGVTLTSCYPQVVYGPPESYETPTKPTESTTYEPSTEEIQDVYGPPPVEYEDTTASVTEADVLPDETTEAAVTDSNDMTTKPVNMQVVYGPPNSIDEKYN